MAWLAWGCMTIQAQVPTASEYEVKAAFLFNFVQYVDWPPQAFAAPQSPVVIGILGDDPFGDIIDRIVRGETVKNRRVVVQRSRQIDSLKDCHLLFISKSEKGRLAQIFYKLAGRSVLTVGETDQFAQSGGVINFHRQGANIRFEINLDTAASSGLKISSKLLRLANIIHAGREKEGS
jgi:YfiR/HmsC-like